MIPQASFSGHIQWNFRFLDCNYWWRCFSPFIGTLRYTLFLIRNYWQLIPWPHLLCLFSAGHHLRIFSMSTNLCCCRVLGGEWWPIWTFGAQKRLIWVHSWGKKVELMMWCWCCEWACFLPCSLVIFMVLLFSTWWWYIFLSSDMIVQCANLWLVLIKTFFFFFFNSCIEIH